MRKKIVPITSVILVLFIIFVVAFLISKNKTKELASDIVENPVNKLSEATPTNPPDTLPYYLMLNGNLITLCGDFQPISPNTQEKIDNSELLGITVEPVAGNEFPTEELQSNFIGKNWSLYYYEDNSQEAYIFVDNNKENHCFYQTLK